MLRSVFVCVSISAVVPAAAAPGPVAGRSISELVAGAHVEIDAPLGNKIPVQFSADGKMSGSAPELAGYLGAPSDTGRWWVKGDELCSQWERWLNRRMECLRLSKEGNRIHWVNQEGRAGTASIVARAKPQIATAPRAEAAKPAARTTPGKQMPAAPVPAAKPQPAPKVPVMIASAWSAQGAQNSAVERPAPASAVVPAAVAPKAEPEILSGARTGPAPATLQPQRSAAGSGGALFRVARVDASDVLFVREGPSAEHLALGALMPDAHDIRITGACRARWCPVKHGQISGWVNRAFLEPASLAPGSLGAKPAVVAVVARPSPPPSRTSAARARPLSDPNDAPRSCLSEEARDLLETIEERFGPVELVSTCRPGATIAGTGRPSRHASGDAIDFRAGDRKAAIVAWLAANHRDGGTMTYGNMDHIHADIGPHFVSLAARDRAVVQSAQARDWSESRMSLWGGRR